MAKYHLDNSDTVQLFISDRRRVDYRGLGVAINGQISNWIQTDVSYRYRHSYSYAEPKHESIKHVSQLPSHKIFL
ncbi:hypothetical protein [Moellerella wisconsensis]|uniref:Uncharacterized protein n=1 Tax=Moellerella wisconsensis TaxID=158849 RepID=A0A9Q8Q033_9GAMM|nr:hypothetical protein [Moellerella wisconsensis]UNH30458.1 hypothetical protein MNY72_14145 [Moellerella wisconsensis]